MFSAENNFFIFVVYSRKEKYKQSQSLDAEFKRRGKKVKIKTSNTKDKQFVKIVENLFNHRQGEKRRKLFFILIYVSCLASTRKQQISLSLFRLCTIGVGQKIFFTSLTRSRSTVTEILVLIHSLRTIH
jgi:hypothetical protein